MLQFTKGNLLEAQVEALVNTVNTVGVMGKGIALMFKERFPQNMEAYAEACKAKRVETGKMFVTETGELMGPKWIVNFPTKRHWRHRSKLEWIEAGLDNLKNFIVDEGVKSIAIPPLGAGNGGLDWSVVRHEIEERLGDLADVEILVFEPTQQYQNIAKKKGVEKLTPARALVAELVRRYWVLGMECSLLEIQKLAWFLERVIERQQIKNPLDLQFEANNYGPYADRLRHLLDGLDGSYLNSDKRIADSAPSDVIWFDESKRQRLEVFLQSESRDYLPALEEATAIIDGFESPYGLELLATIDWLLTRENCDPTPDAVMEGIRHWPAGEHWAARKEKLFDRYSVEVALKRLEATHP